MQFDREQLAQVALEATDRLRRSIQGYVVVEARLARWDAGLESMTLEEVEQAITLLAAWDHTLHSFIQWGLSADRKNKARGVTPEDAEGEPVTFTQDEREYLKWLEEQGGDSDAH